MIRLLDCKSHKNLPLKIQLSMAADLHLAAAQVDRKTVSVQHLHRLALE